MKKRILVLALTAILLLSAGCSGKPSASTTLLDEVQSAGVLKVGIEGTFPPFTYHDEQDNITGFDVDVALAVAEKLGVEVQFTETKWDSLIAGLDANQYDTVFNNVAITSERQEKYDFSRPYSYSYSTLIVRSDYDEINSFADLEGKKSAQSLSSNYAGEAEQHGAELIGTDGFAQSIELVLTGRADVTVNDDVTFHDYMKQHPDAPLKIIDEKGETTSIAAIFRKNTPEFKEAIDKALDELDSEGVLTEISMKYFGADITKN